jgi:hypothetical protein
VPVFTSSVRVGLVLAVCALALSVGRGEPNKKPALRPNYTAFPDHKHPRGLVDVKEGERTFKREQTQPLPPPPLAELGANPTPLRRVRYELAQNGLQNLKFAGGGMLREIIGGPRPDYAEGSAAITETHRLCADLEPTLAKRVPWYEARVRDLKEYERHIAVRVDFGSEAPHELSHIRFVRLRAEAELLELQAEVAKTK